MPIDSNILPRRGTYQGIDYSDRYRDLVSNSNFLISDIETGRKSWYMGNAYTTYVGGDGVMNSKWDVATATSSEISGSPSLEGHPVNISLAVSDTDGSGRWGNIRASAPAHNAVYLCPAIAFDPNTICIDIRAIVATQATGGSEGWNTAEIAFKNIEVDETYAGIMETGVSTGGNKVLIGYKFNFYVGTATARTYTNRLAIVAENAPPCPESWDVPQNFYFFVPSGYNNTVSGIRINNLYQYAYTNYSDGVKAGRKLDDTSLMCIDANGAPACSEAYTISGTLPTGWGAIPNSGWWYNRGRYASAGDQLLAACIPGEFVLKMAAATGLFFTTVTSLAETGGIGVLSSDPDIHLGVITPDGYTKGEYVSGTDCISQIQSTWTNAIADAETAGYKPIDPTGEIPPEGDPNKYDDDNATVLPTPAYTAGNKIYAVNVGELGSVLDVISLEAAALETELETVQKFLTNNPIDAIAGALYYPFDVSSIITTELTQTEIILGNIPTGVDGYKVTNRVGVYNMGKCTYYPPDGIDDFRSYEPYSSAELYVPYCGSVKISPADYIGHEISVKYLIDIESGGCVALIYRDALAIDSIAGQIGVRIPISGVQTATLAAAQEQSQRNSINAKVATAAAIVGVGAAVFTAGTSLALTAAAVGGATALTAAATRLDATQYELEHQQIPYKTVGSAGAATSTCNEQSVRLVIHRPVMLDNYDAEIYGRTKGFACLITATLSVVSGYTQVSNADLSGIPATEREKELILEALKDGTII